MLLYFFLVDRYELRLSSDPSDVKFMCVFQFFYGTRTVQSDVLCICPHCLHVNVAVVL